MTDTPEYDQDEWKWRRDAPHRCFLCRAELQRGEQHDCPRLRAPSYDPTRDVGYGPGSGATEQGWNAVVDGRTGAASPYATPVMAGGGSATADRRFQLARDLLVAHVREVGMVTNPQYDRYATERSEECLSAVAYADLLLAALAKPREGGE